MDDNNMNNTQNSSFEPSDQSYSYTPNTTYHYAQPPMPPQPPKKNKRQFGAGALVLCVILSVIISTGASLAIALGAFSGGSDNDSSDKINKETASVTTSTESNSNDVSSHDNNQTTSDNNTSDNKETVSTVITIDGNVESVVEAVYDKSANCVVGIRTKASVENIFGGETESTGEGSGVIYTEDGYIITNYHVIKEIANDYSKKSSLEVFMMSEPNNPIDAKVVGYNISADLAVIKVEKTGLPVVEMADSDKIKVGQYAIAIGCPGGIEFLNSVSYGIISGLNRTITIDSIGEMKLIQTDAAINPGNSGGALLNSKGELIGINSSKLVDESFEGMGFAIPTKTVLEVVQDIMDSESNPSPYIGIEIYKYDSNYLAQYNLPAGAAVKSVVKNGPADVAHIRAGDIITEFDSVEIKEYTDFIDTFDKCTPGSTVTVRIYRNGRYYSAYVTIGSNNSRG